MLIWVGVDKINDMVMGDCGLDVDGSSLHLVLERPFHLLVADRQLCSEGNLKAVSAKDSCNCCIIVSKRQNGQSNVHLIHLSLLNKFGFRAFGPVHLHLRG